MTFPRWIELAPTDLADREELARRLLSARVQGAVMTLDPTADAARVREIEEILRDAGSRLRAVAVTGDIHTGTVSPVPEGLWRVCAELGVALSLVLVSTGSHDAPSSPRGDVRAAKLIVPMLDHAVAMGVPLALEPRAGAWLGRVDDAVRLGIRINRDELGVVFRAPDWRACDNAFLEARIDLAIHRLHNVVVDALEETQVLELLARKGYVGPVTQARR